MKALVIESSGENVQLLITSQELPIVGRYYTLEDAIEGTAAQNKTFHALTMEYFRSGHHSYDVSSYAEFKIEIKKHLGEGYECHFYIVMVNGIPELKKVKSKDEIPAEIRKDPSQGLSKMKSFRDYTKKQRKNCIDNVITEMLAAGVNTPKFEEILKGLNHGEG